MSSFVGAMSSPALTKKGVNSSDVYTEDGVGDLRVALFTMLVRGLSESEICATLDKTKSVSNEFICDLFVIAFQTRDIRGGKGERDLFTILLSKLFEVYPSYIQVMIPLIPEYGCWKDLWSLYLYVSDKSQREVICNTIDTVVCKQFRKDWVELDIHWEEARLSLLGKWMPREGSKNNLLAKHYATLLFPSFDNDSDRLRAYRKACSHLNMMLKTTEVNMCNGTWHTIVPEKVPGRCLKKCNAAFLNEIPKHVYIKAKLVSEVRGRKIHVKGKLVMRKCTGTRFSDNEDRVECAKNFEEFLKKSADGRVRAKGANTVYPHEITIGMSHAHSDNQIALLEAQWKSISESIKKEGQLKSIVPLCDVSSSMAGIPMEVSIALGILISEVAEPAFKDHVLTFQTNPSWVSFADCKNLKEKIDKARHAPWGGSTNFQSACNMILQRLVEHKVAPEDAPKDMLVLTDMGFDEAMPIDKGHGYDPIKKSSSWETIITSIRNAFKVNGYEAPRIVIWNLRAAYKDFHANAHEEGVIMLSGWSPAVLKAIQKNGIELGTPYTGMRMLLDDKRYDKVRSAFNSLKTSFS